MATPNGESDAYLAVIDEGGAITSRAVLSGPGAERIKGLGLVAPGVLAAWGCHDGITQGGTAIASAGVAEGFYAELRLDALFQ